MTTVESQLVVLGQAVTLWNTPSRIRTYDLRIRSPLLYPAELWALVCGNYRLILPTIIKYVYAALGAILEHFQFPG